MARPHQNAGPRAGTHPSGAAGRGTPIRRKENRPHAPLLRKGSPQAGPAIPTSRRTHRYGRPGSDQCGLQEQTRSDRYGRGCRFAVGQKVFATPEMTSIYKEPLLDLHIAESEFLHGRYESPVDVGIRETLRFPWLTVLDFSAAAHVDYDVLAVSRWPLPTKARFPWKTTRLPRLRADTASILSRTHWCRGSGALPGSKHSLSMCWTAMPYQRTQYSRETTTQAAISVAATATAPVTEPEVRHPPDQEDAEKDRDQEGNIPAPAAHQRIDRPAGDDRNVSAVGRCQRPYRLTDDLTHDFCGVFNVKLRCRGEIRVVSRSISCRE